MDRIETHPLKRQPVYGQNGMIAASQPLAAQAGLDILKKGGNAVDAAIAAAACLTVVEPTSCGIGGDAFALVWSGGKLYGLNSGGPAPLNISIDKLTEKGYEKMPSYGWCPVTVPGVPGAWAELSNRFGKLSLSESLKSAIEYGENGYPVSPVVASSWKKAYDIYKENLKGEEFRFWFDTFAPKGRAPRAGEIWDSMAHTETLRQIAETNSVSFYKGELADKIDKFSREYGGYIRKEDLESFKPIWIEPINIKYRGYDIWEMPPNSQGLVALSALNILNGYKFDIQDEETYHKQIEAIKLAFKDCRKYITDIDKMKIDYRDFLTEKHAGSKRTLIKDCIAKPEILDLKSGGTVYLTTADSFGNMVSYIQSNYINFGSGLVVPHTGIALQSRGVDFSMNPFDANCLEPGKRSYHTIIPGFITKSGEAIGSFGVTGAYMQPQGHIQVVMNMLDFGMNPQDALDAPRWQWVKGNEVAIETHFSEDTAKKLCERGHEIIINQESSVFGRGQIILKNKDGVFVGGTESRADSSIGVY